MKKNNLGRTANDINGAGIQRTLDVSLFGPRRPIETKIFKCLVNADNGITVKELVMRICKDEQIPPNHSALFGISLDAFGENYIPYTKTVKPATYEKKTLFFRLQFKALDCLVLRKDGNEKALNYYLLQCRHDFVHGHFKKNFTKLGLKDRKEKQQILLRMVILEMLLQSDDEAQPPSDRTMRLQNFFRKRSNYGPEKILEKYVDERDEVKKCKKIIEKSLQMFKDVKEPKFDFVREIELLPNYRKELLDKIFKVYGSNDVTGRDDIWITVHPKEGVSRLRRIDDKFKKADDRFQFENIDSLELKSTEENAVAKYQLIIGRRKEVPEVLYSDSDTTLECLCSWIDGYYRLFVNQYVSLLDANHSKMAGRNYHGPIEHSVSENVLKSYGSSEGDFLIREHRLSHGKFVLSVRGRDRPEHYEIYRHTDQTYFIQEGNHFASLEALVNFYQYNADSNLTLKRNIKPVKTGPMPFLSEQQSVSLMKKQVVPSPHRSAVSWISLKSIIKEKDLGKGRFGEVFLCKQRGDTHAQNVVVRQFRPQDISKEAFERIAKHYKEMTNRLIVRLTGSSSFEDEIRLLAFEHMEMGPLDEYLQKHRDTITYRSVLIYMTDITEGMLYLEKMRLVHGNLRLRNVLLMDKDNIKISDACFDWVMQQEGRLEVLSSSNWKAPEVLRGEPMTQYSDVWSLGVVIWDIVSLSKPLGNIGKDKLLEALSDDVMLRNSFGFCPKELKKIVADCWEENPEERIHFEEIHSGLRTLKHKVGSRLLERPYYSWYRIQDRIEEEERDQGRQHRINAANSIAAMNSGAPSSGSSESLEPQSSFSSGDFSGSGSSSKPYHVIEDNRKTNSSMDASWSSMSSIHSLESAKSNDKSEFASNSKLADSKATQCYDIEMKDLTVENSPSDFTGKKSVATNARSTSFMECDAYQCSTDTKALSNLSDLVKDISGPRTDVSTRKPREKLVIHRRLSRSASDDQSEQGEKPTSDVMEVANVLVAMAQNHGSEQKRRNPGKGDGEGQKPPKMMPQLSKAILVKPGVPLRLSQSSKSSKYPNIVRAIDRQYSCDSAYESSGPSTYGSIMNSAPGKVVSRQPEQVVATARPNLESTANKSIEEDLYVVERKKRSHSISEETAKMQKKAAKSALDGPNPFNLASVVPKNFLKKRTDPGAYLKSQPVDASKYFHELMGASLFNKPQTDVERQPTNNTVLQNNHQTSSTIDPAEPAYKSLSDMQMLDQKMSYLKTASPQAVSQPTSPISQAPADMHSAINAYLTQLLNQGNSIVAGNPVFIPHTANVNQAANLPQLLHLFQAQQKTLMAGNVSQQALAANRQMDPAMQINPAYLQALYAIMASKGVLGSSASYNQLTQTVPVQALISSPAVVQDTTGFLSTAAPTNTTSAVSSTSSEVCNNNADINQKVAAAVTSGQYSQGIYKTLSDFQAKALNTTTATPIQYRTSYKTISATEAPITQHPSEIYKSAADLKAKAMTTTAAANSNFSPTLYKKTTNFQPKVTTATSVSPAQYRASYYLKTSTTAVTSNQHQSELYKTTADMKPQVVETKLESVRKNRINPLNAELKTAGERSQLFQPPQRSPAIPQTALRSLVIDNKSHSPRPIFAKSTQAQQPLLIDVSKQNTRPVLLKPAGNSPAVRLQPLLPKGLPDQLDSKKDVLYSKSHVMQTGPTSSQVVQTPVGIATLDGDNYVQATPSNRIKIEPRTVSLDSAINVSHDSYKPMSPTLSSASPTRPDQQNIASGKIRGSSAHLSQVQRRRQSEENSNMIAKLGNIKIYNNDDLKMEKKLGEGQFGVVWKAILRCLGVNGHPTQYPVAVKKLKGSEEQSIEQFKNEVRQLAKLDHDNIVKLIGVSIDPKGEADGPWIITDLMPLGNLNRFIVNRRKTLSEDILLRFAVQIADGMEFLESYSIVHRDLAARNVLVESMDRVKVCDFGLSRMFSDNKDYYKMQTPTMLPIRWYALESIQDKKFTSKSDVWSYGVTLWEMFTLWGTDQQEANPYDGMNGDEMLEYIQNKQRLAKPERCKDVLWGRILKCWEEKPDDRPSFFIISLEIKKSIVD